MKAARRDTYAHARPWNGKRVQLKPGVPHVLKPGTVLTASLETDNDARLGARRLVIAQRIGAAQRTSTPIRFGEMGDMPFPPAVFRHCSTDYGTAGDVLAVEIEVL